MHSIVAKPFLRFVGALVHCLVVATVGFLPLSSSAQEADPQTAPQDGTSREVRVGDLGFRITSLRVSSPAGGDTTSTATVSMTVRNLGATPIALNYSDRTVTLVDDHGYTYPDNHFSARVVGIGIATARAANTDYVVEPSRDIGIQFQLIRLPGSGQTLGTDYNFSAEFATYQDLGEGRLKRLRAYPVSIIGIHRAPLIQGAIDGAGDKVKKALGSIFH